MKSSKFLNLFLIFIIITSFSIIASAQKKPETAATKIIERMPERNVVGASQQNIAPEVNKIDIAEPKVITVKITGVNSVDKTFTIVTQGKSLTLSSINLKARPTIGALLTLKEDRTKYIYSNCESCKTSCPGVCFLEPDYCRCYLEHL